MKRKTLNILLFLLILIVIMGLIYFMNDKEEKTAFEPTTYEYNDNPNYYTERFRPQYHLSPTAGDMSDPNGMVYFEGEYHQFYQNKGEWGHAISEDLLHWDHYPLAITRDELGDAWSGSAVVDWNNTTGFFEDGPGLVAIFTHFNQGLQSQSLAYSSDNGRTWTKYEGNPVIPNPNLKDFRDPSVFWHEETEKWVMGITADDRVLFFNSPNLIDWEQTSEFGWDQGSHAAVWECVDLFELPIEGTDEKKWVMTLSIGDNRQTNGSTAQYFVGSFDGETFTNDNQATDVLWTDYGKDFYAAVSYSDIPEEDGRRIWLGWMSNWRYPFSQPTGSWKGNMSIPRVLTLRDVPEEGIRLIQTPLEELASLRGTTFNIEKQEIKPGDNPLENIKGMSYEMDVEFELISDAEFGFKLRQGVAQETIVSYDPEKEMLKVDRTNAGISDFEENFAEVLTAPLKPKDNKIKLRIFVDDSTLEVFANDGEVVQTNLIFPDPTSLDVELFTTDGNVMLNNLDFYQMKGIWRDENPDDKNPIRIVMNEPLLRIKQGEKKQLIGAVLPVNAPQDLIWTIKDENIALIEVDGNVVDITGEEVGNTQIEARTTEGDVVSLINVFVNEGKSGESNDNSKNEESHSADTEDNEKEGVNQESEVHVKLSWTDQAPKLDGLIDGIWEDVEKHTIDNQLIGEEEGFSATWKGLWDEDNLYLLIEVIDQHLSEEQLPVFESDSIEIFLDGVNSKSTTYNEFTRMYEMRWFDEVPFAKTEQTEQGYTVKAEIPWSTVNVSEINIDQLIGFDIHVNNNNTGKRDAKLSWFATKDESWDNPSLFGVVQLIK